LARKNKREKKKSIADACGLWRRKGTDMSIGRSSPERGKAPHELKLIMKIC